MKLSLLHFSVVILGVHQVIAAPAPVASVSSSMESSNAVQAVPDATSSLAAPTVLPVADAAEGSIALDLPLVQELGWGQNDIDVLTGFLEAIERLGELAGSQQSLDPVTQQLLRDFQAEARELIANAGYTYQLAKDSTEGLVLSRIFVEDGVGAIGYHPKGIPEVVEGLVKGLAHLLETLKKKADDGSVISQWIYTLVNNLLTTLGKKLEEAILPKIKPELASSPTPAKKLPLSSSTFLH
ncbi:hypothetical protein BCR42DRAFT_494205 [Absidia repens]|uniref:Uncharacterized protein n=1 Tax=Absidia repens TaxID=90262 RepID=A0A1X2I7P6_9FUNG|nr:hypothetical protein BCR42DRAFT_494205 [Absidia repens]